VNNTRSLEANCAALADDACALEDVSQRHKVVPDANSGIGGMTMFERPELGVSGDVTSLTGNVGGGVKWHAPNNRWGLRRDDRYGATQSKGLGPPSSSVARRDTCIASTPPSSSTRRDDHIDDDARGICAAGTGSPVTSIVRKKRAPVSAGAGPRTTGAARGRC
jgi:hypothetical protein